MKYAETINTNSLGHYTFLLNSIYDPNFTGVGHQPYGHDTFSALYNRYRVISCSFKVTASSGTNVQLVALPANGGYSFTTASEYKENPLCKYRIQSSNGNLQPVTGKVHIPSLVGRTKAQYMADDRYQAQFGSSPDELAVLNLGAFNSADGALSNIPLNVELVYTVELFDIKNLPQS